MNTASRKNKEGNKIARKTVNIGRPSLDKDKKRTIRHELKLNKYERKKLELMTASSNFKSANELIRAMLFDNSVKIYFEDKSREKVIYQLSKIGGNINQIAKSMNQMKSTYNSVSDKEMGVINELLSCLKSIKV